MNQKIDHQELGGEDLVLMKKSVKIVKQTQVQNGVEDPVDIKRSPPETFFLCHNIFVDFFFFF